MYTRFESPYFWAAELSSNVGLAIKEQHTANPLIFEHKFTNGVPPTGQENVRINLWLYRGHPPTNRNPVEIIVNRFEFIPQ